jgi:hypothetical protein
MAGEFRKRWLGLAFLTSGMAALVTAIVKGNNWGRDAPATLATTATALVLLSVLFGIERRVASPIIDFKLLWPLIVAISRI